MNAVNQIEMIGTRMAIAQARKFPFVIALVAKQIQGPVAEFIIDCAETFVLAGEKMYVHFDSVNKFVDVPYDMKMDRVVRLCYFVEQEFGECIFSIEVKRRDGE